MLFAYNSIHSDGNSSQMMLLFESKQTIIECELQPNLMQITKLFYNICCCNSICFYNMLITIVLQNAKNRALFRMEVDFYSNS